MNVVSYTEWSFKILNISTYDMTWSVFVWSMHLWAHMWVDLFMHLLKPELSVMSVVLYLIWQSLLMKLELSSCMDFPTSKTLASSWALAPSLRLQVHATKTRNTHGFWDPSASAHYCTVSIFLLSRRSCPCPSSLTIYAVLTPCHLSFDFDDVDWEWG